MEGEEITVIQENFQYLKDKCQTECQINEQK